MKSKLTSNLLIFTSILAWVASLVFAALLTRNGPVFGLQLLVGGAFGVLVGQFAWYANPAYFLALYWIVMFKPKQARIASSLSLALALLPLISRRVWLHEGFSTPITGYGIGFMLWLGAIALVCVVTWAFPRQWISPPRAPA